MSFLNDKVKLTIKGQYQWWSIITYLLFGLMIGSLLLSSILIYNYTFRTLEDAHTIVLLNTDSVVNNVNLDMYKKAVDAIKIKNVPVVSHASLRNIFVYNTSSPAIIPTKSSEMIMPTTSTATYATSTNQ